MSRVEIRSNHIMENCVCHGQNAKYRLIIKGHFASPQAEIPLCEACFKELKKKLAD